jgi:TatD DNase family protein
MNDHPLRFPALPDTDLIKSRLTAYAYIDLHCHRRSAAEALEILSVDTSEMTQLADGQGFYTLGIHPWYIDRQETEMALQKILAVADDPNLLAIGECGLDRAVNTPLSMQMKVFDNQIELAERIGKPLIVHCVRAFNELSALKKAAKPRQAWVIHGFTGKPLIAGQLLKQGFYFSFGKALLQENSNACKVLAEMPLDRLFLETDAAEAPISGIYASAAKILALDVETLQHRIFTNFKRVFLHE